MPEDDVRMVDVAVVALLAPAARFAARTFPGTLDGLDRPGLYAWFVDAPGAGDLATGLGFTVEPGLIYAGQAGAGRSSTTLRGRLRGNHLGGNVRGSTFRLTLATILQWSLGLAPANGARSATSDPRFA